MSKSDAVKIFLLGMITAFLAVIALRPQQGVAVAGDAAVSGNIMAVAGPDKACLFLINTADQQIAQYTNENARFSLRGARFYGNDLKIEEAANVAGIPIADAKKLAEGKGGKK